MKITTSALAARGLQRKPVPQIERPTPSPPTIMPAPQVHVAAPNAPQVHVAPPAVNVAAPAVSVAAPYVHVAPVFDSPALVQAIQNMKPVTSRRPVGMTMTVTRDTSGLVESTHFTFDYGKE